MYSMSETIRAGGVVRVVVRIPHVDGDERLEGGYCHFSQLDALVESMCRWGVGDATTTSQWERKHITGEYAVIDEELIFEITLDSDADTPV